MVNPFCFCLVARLFLPQRKRRLPAFLCSIGTADFTSHVRIIWPETVRFFRGFDYSSEEMRRELLELVAVESRAPEFLAVCVASTGPENVVFCDGLLE